MKAAGNTITGMQRKNNEDAIYISGEGCPLPNLYVVADGMGGHNAGEIASHDAIRLFLSYLGDNVNAHTMKSELLDLLVGAVQYANGEIYQKAVSDEKFYGMGTTFTCAVVLGKKLFVVHVGDSRAYLLRNQTLIQLTKDHSYVMEMVKQGKMTMEEAEIHPQKNVITRAVGTRDTIEIDTLIEELQSEDKILLCTDGLTNMLTEEEMIAAIDRGTDLESAVNQLMETANANGGKDNISAIIIE